nr:MAG TPA: hypothetical protein [Caudoviricetes sp.]
MTCSFTENLTDYIKKHAFLCKKPTPRLVFTYPKSPEAPFSSLYIFQ